MSTRTAAFGAAGSGRLLSDGGTTPPAALPVYTPVGLEFVANAGAPPNMTSNKSYLTKVAELPDRGVDIPRYGPTTPSSVVIALSGTSGTAYYTNKLPNNSLMVDLAAAGIALYSPRFTGGSWVDAPLGVRAGHSRVAARFVPIVNQIKAENGWTSPTVRGTGAQVILLTNSFGSNLALAFSAWYDTPRTTKGIIFTAGPHPYIRKQCSGLSEDFAYSTRAPGEATGSMIGVAPLHDSPFGYAEQTGPCFLGAGNSMDALYAEADPTVNPLANLDWTGMYVRFLHGTLDPTPFESWVRTWLTDMGRSTSIVQSVTGGKHELHDSTAGVAAIKTAILAAAA